MAIGVTPRVGQQQDGDDLAVGVEPPRAELVVGLGSGDGITPRISDFMAASAFRGRFERKSRYSAYLATIHTWVIDCPISPAMQGAINALALTEDAA